MYEVRNKHNQPVRSHGQKVQDMVLNVAKARAEALHKLNGERYDVWEVRQVWTTQTLDEAIKQN